MVARAVRPQRERADRGDQEARDDDEAPASPPPAAAASHGREARLHRHRPSMPDDVRPSPE